MAKAKSKVVPIEWLTIIDEAGALEREITAAADALSARFAAKEARLAFLRAAILDWYSQAPAEQAIALAGEKYVANISPRGNQSTIDVEKVFHKLGVVEFFKFATVPLGALRKLLSKTEQPQFIATARTGARTLELIRARGGRDGQSGVE